MYLDGWAGCDQEWIAHFILGALILAPVFLLCLLLPLLILSVRPEREHSYFRSSLQVRSHVQDSQDPRIW